MTNSPDLSRQRSRHPLGVAEGGQYAEEKREHSGVRLCTTAAEVTYRDDEFGEYVIGGGFDIRMQEPDDGEFFDNHLDVLHTMYQAGVRGQIEVGIGPGVEHQWEIMAATESGDVLSLSPKPDDPQLLQLVADHPIAFTSTFDRGSEHGVKAAMEELLVNIDIARFTDMNLEDLDGVECQQVHPGVSVLIRNGTPHRVHVLPATDPEGGIQFQGSNGEPLTDEQACRTLDCDPSNAAALREAVEDAHHQARSHHSGSLRFMQS